MKTGIEIIADERKKQIEKHGFTGEHHADHPEWYDQDQLITCARLLIYYKDDENSDGLRNSFRMMCPENWDKEWFEDMFDRPYEDRKRIAGALIAAEFDRLSVIESRANAL